MSLINFFAEHLYFLSALYFFVLFWIPLFIVNKKGRKWMIRMSILGLLLGPIVQNLHLADWWQPNYLFDTYFKLEDLLFGFAVAGLISSVYSWFKLKFQKTTFHKPFPRMYQGCAVIVSSLLFFGLFYLADVHSFWSSIIAGLLLILVVVIKRPITLRFMVLTGIILAVIALPGYLFGIHLNPDFIQTEWLIDQLSGSMILGVPIEEFIWFFLAGLWISAFQELFTNEKV